MGPDNPQVGPNLAPADAGLEQSGDGGIVAHHPRLATLSARVAPTIESRFNTLGLNITPLACWRAHDMRFHFGSSFPRPEIRAELRGLKKLINVHTLTDPKTNVSRPPTLSVFGHADPTGDDEFNKVLSGRRAQSLFGVLTRDVDLLEELFSKPHGQDRWGDAELRLMVTTVDPAKTPAAQDSEVNAAKTDAARRRALYRQYAEVLCVGPDGKSFVVAKSDFLGGGTDAKGKGDFQGCSEFNPIMVFSKAERLEFSSPERTPKRDAENAANRRVVIFLFRPGIIVNPSTWPCPRATEPTARCRTRFFSNAETRRSNSDERRLYEQTHDTFACRFYDRLSNKSPCERFQPRLMPFRYGLEVSGEMPWTESATLRFVSDDGKHEKKFLLSEGTKVAGLRVFIFDDYLRGVKYRGEVMEGESIIKLFDSAHLFGVLDPSDADELLPIPATEPAVTPEPGAFIPPDTDPSRQA